MMEVKQKAQKKGWYQYLLLGIGTLITVLIIVVVVYFWDEMRDVESVAYGYGYAGAFFAGILCGVSIIPAPTLLLVFTLGGVLNPTYVGLIAGFGGALGGITVYLTGAGMGTLWSRFQPKEQTAEHQRSPGYDIVEPVEAQVLSKGQAFYNRLVRWVGGWGASWVLLIVAAMPISPFYFAGLAAGSLRMGLLRFFLISWAGKTVRALIIAFAGYWGLHYLLRWIGG